MKVKRCSNRLKIKVEVRGENGEKDRSVLVISDWDVEELGEAAKKVHD